MRRIALGSALAFGLVLGSGAAAFAGETTGNGSPVPGSGHANSACAFSGQDQPDASENNPPGFDDDAVTIPGKRTSAVPSGTQVQNYGQYVAAGAKEFVPSPGVACRGGAEGGE